MDRRKTRDVLFFVFQCAKQDRQSYAEAWPAGSPERKQAYADAKLFERMQKKIFGTTKSRLDQEIETMKPISISQLSKWMEENPDLVNTD